MSLPFKNLRRYVIVCVGALVFSSLLEAEGPDNSGMGAPRYRQSGHGIAKSAMLTSDNRGGENE